MLMHLFWEFFYEADGPFQNSLRRITTTDCPQVPLTFRKPHVQNISVHLSGIPVLVEFEGNIRPRQTVETNVETGDQTSIISKS